MNQGHIKVSLLDCRHGRLVVKDNAIKVSTLHHIQCCLHPIWNVIIKRKGGRRRYSTSPVLMCATHYLYVMDYDTRSQVFDMCIASANAPFAGMVHGIQRYLELGIESQKLILGVPWYGYRYPCLPTMTDVHSQFCPIPQVAFRGVNCSDAVGSEIQYGRILQRYATTAASCRSHMKRDEFMDAVYFNSQEEADHGNETRIYQYWFDDATALTHKFAWAKSMQLGGIGPYTFDDLDPDNFPNESRAMWSAFDAFFFASNHSLSVSSSESNSAGVEDETSLN